MIKLVLKVVMAAFYIFSGFNHFRDPGFYLNIMPPYFPAHDAAVVWSGVAEVVLGGLLLWPRGQWLAAWGIVAMLVAFLPASIRRPRWCFYGCAFRCRRCCSRGRIGTRSSRFGTRFRCQNYNIYKLFYKKNLHIYMYFIIIFYCFMD